MRKPREIAIRCLQSHERSKDYIETILQREFARTPIAPNDRSLIQELVYGCVRWKRLLDWLIDRKTDARPQKPALRTLLQLGLYQLFWLDRIPDHAAVHETVELAKEFGFGSQSGFINAILRGYLREKSQTQELLRSLRETQPGVALSHPDWLVARWVERWGAEAATNLMTWNNTPPQVFARVNTLRTQPGQLLQRWREVEHVEYDFVHPAWAPENTVFVLKSHPPLESLASFREGWFYVQDPSTLLAVRELAPQPGERILDFCAAPGGKTTRIAELMNNRGTVMAQDISPDRLRLLEENLTRLGVTCAQTRLPPANDPVENSIELFDRVLVDAPCSNTGVLRRRLDLRWRVTAEEVNRLATTQLALLQHAAANTKPDGTLVYSTCSLEPQENQGIIALFLKSRPEFLLESERELLPCKDAVDGAYVARLKRLRT